MRIFGIFGGDGKRRCRRPSGPDIDAHYCGIDIKKIDRHAPIRQELDVEIVKMAIKMIKEDEGLRRVIVRAKAFELMNMKDPDLEPKAPRPDPPDDLIAKYEKAQRIRDLVKAGKPSFWEELLDTIKEPGVLSALLNGLTNIIAKQPGGPAPWVPPPAQELSPPAEPGKVVIAEPAGGGEPAPPGLAAPAQEPPNQPGPSP